MSSVPKWVMVYVVASLSLLIAGGITLTHFFEKSQTQNALVSALNDTVHRYQTTDGKNAAYIQSIVADRDQLITIAKQKDSVVAVLLQGNKKITDITRVKTETRIDTALRVDTVYVVENGVKIKPDSLVLSKNVTDKWYNEKIDFRNDSLILKLVTFDDLIVDHHLTSQGLFKPDILDVNVINENPHSQNIGLDSYVIPIPKPKPFIPFIAGAAATILLMILIHK
jgi:hypothetical protein